MIKVRRQGSFTVSTRSPLYAGKKKPEAERKPEVARTWYTHLTNKANTNGSENAKNTEGGV